MQDAPQIVTLLALGAFFGACFVWVARSFKPGSRQFLAYGLIATAAIYVGLAVRSDNVTAWLGIEMTGIAIYGSFALLSLIGSPWWLAAGWAAHPLWAIQFHYLGTGSAFTPEWFPLIDTGLDLAIAAYVAFAALRGIDRPREAEPVAPAAKPAKKSKGRAR